MCTEFTRVQCACTGFVYRMLQDVCVCVYRVCKCTGQECIRCTCIQGGYRMCVQGVCVYMVCVSRACMYKVCMCRVRIQGMCLQGMCVWGMHIYRVCIHRMFLCAKGVYIRGMCV